MLLTRLKICRLSSLTFMTNKIMMYKAATEKSTTNHPTFASVTKYAHQFPKTMRFQTANPE